MSDQSDAASDEASEGGGGGRWFEAAVIALLVALAPVRIGAKVADIDVPWWVHGVLFVLFTVAIERVLRRDAEPGAGEPD